MKPFSKSLMLLAVVATAPLGACKVVIERSSDSARSDTTVDLTTHRPDTAAVVTPAAPQVAVAGGEVGDSAAETTSSDLATLASELIVPIPGVKKADLPDTFNDMRDGGRRKHEALDIMAPRGTPVLSASAGRVLKLHNSQDGGLMVYAADRSNRFVLLYGHLDRYADGLRDSLPLRQGQIIGYVGSTGNASPNAPHLHFAIAHPKDVNLWWTGTPIDPRPVLLQSASP